MENNVFTCGHTQPIPSNMGRGKARAKRLAEYFGRRCKDCTIQHIKEQDASFTDIHGNPRQAPSASLEERIKKIARTYWGSLDHE